VKGQTGLSLHPHDSSVVALVRFDHLQRLVRNRRAWRTCTSRSRLPLLLFVAGRRREAGHSRYLKVRDRASYEFALVSVAAALDVAGDRVRDARIVLGGVAHRP
jgi:CO/xanthine dehydrogenase FAD-binding subunit